MTTKKDRTLRTNKKQKQQNKNKTNQESGICFKRIGFPICTEWSFYFAGIEAWYAYLVFNEHSNKIIKMTK